MVVSGVVDRIEGDLAVILVEELSQEHYHHSTSLQEGDWLKIKLSNNEIQYYEHDVNKSMRMKRLAKEKKEKLRERMKSNFKK